MTPRVTDLAAIPGGNSLPSPVTSNSNTMSILLVTGSSAAGTGFTFTLDFHGKCHSVQYIAQGSRSISEFV